MKSQSIFRNSFLIFCITVAACSCSWTLSILLLIIIVISPCYTGQYIYLIIIITCIEYSMTCSLAQYDAQEELHTVGHGNLEEIEDEKILNPVLITPA